MLVTNSHSDFWATLDHFNGSVHSEHYLAKTSIDCYRSRFNNPPRPITIDQVPPLWLVLTLINRHNPDTSPLGLCLMLITSVLISRITTRPGPKCACWAKSPAGVRYKLTPLRQVRIISLWLFYWHRQEHGSASSGCMLLPWFFFALSLTSIAMTRTPQRSYAQAGCQIPNVSPEHFQVFTWRVPFLRGKCRSKERAKGVLITT